MIRIICFLNHFGKIMTETYCQMKYLREKKSIILGFLAKNLLKSTLASWSIMYCD